MEWRVRPDYINQDYTLLGILDKMLKNGCDTYKIQIHYHIFNQPPLQHPQMEVMVVLEKNKMVEKKKYMKMMNKNKEEVEERERKEKTMKRRKSRKNKSNKKKRKRKRKSKRKN